MSPTGDVQVSIGVTSPGSGNETGIAQLVATCSACRRRRSASSRATPTPCRSAPATPAAAPSSTAAPRRTLAAVDLRAKLAAVRRQPAAGAARGDHLRGRRGARAERAPASTIAALALGAHTHPFTVGDGVDLPLEATRSYRARNVRVTPDENGRIATYSSFPYSMHAAAVEVDPGTGRVTVLDVAAVHDCGVMINPALVTGQLKGAIVMGLGAALWEELTHDDRGGPRERPASRPTSCRARRTAGHHASATWRRRAPSIRSASRARANPASAARSPRPPTRWGTRWATWRDLTTVPATPPALMAILAASGTMTAARFSSAMRQEALDILPNRAPGTGGRRRRHGARARFCGAGALRRAHRRPRPRRARRRPARGRRHHHRGAASYTSVRHPRLSVAACRCWPTCCAMG